MGIPKKVNNTAQPREALSRQTHRAKQYTRNVAFLLYLSLMKPIFSLTLALLAAAGVIIFAIICPTPTSINRNTTEAYSNTSIVNTTIPSNTNSAPTSIVVVPIADFFSRVMKKPFGIYVTPQNSPVQPEKFTGYHTGADAETTPAESNIDVPIYSIADGTVVFAGHVNGYGGVIMVQSTVGGETVTALYGHLRISSFTKKQGETVTRGEQIAVLGSGYSTETDGERKHLHLGIIKGVSINYKGYVQTQSELSSWKDPVTWLKARGL